MKRSCTIKTNGKKASPSSFENIIFTSKVRGFVIVTFRDKIAFNS
jgi:hypothetical protein